MPEPLAESLSRFTPDGTGLDRDALLFAAGRASARPNRCWRALAGTLAASQLLTLVFLWPRPAPPAAPPFVAAPAPTVEAPLPPTAVERPLPLADDTPGLVALCERVLAADGDLPSPPPVERLLPPGPPLRAFASPPSALVN